jgi:hypothetical protein
MRASAVPDDCVITLSAADVSKTFKLVKTHKVAGTDGLPGRVLRACANQLASVFTDIFNLSLSESVIPTCFKQTTKVHVPKNTKVTFLNDYQPVALTFVAMKGFKRAGHGSHQHHIHRNPRLQCAYCTKQMMQSPLPSKLITKLRTMGLNTSPCNWILDILTGCPQVIRVGNNTSATLILNTGAPQGCVLSPLLYSLFTHDCKARHDSNTIIKFADDTTVVDLITDKRRQHIGRRSET